MARLPVIVGFGGFSAAGRSSFHQAYQRTVLESLSLAKREQTLVGLAAMMGRVTFANGYYRDASGTVLSASEVVTRFAQDIVDNTLIRRISPSYFDVDNVPGHQAVEPAVLQQPITFVLPKGKLPSPLPEAWHVSPLDQHKCMVTVDTCQLNNSIKIPYSYVSAAQCAGQLPDGFDPAQHYSVRFHPRGLQLSILGASDAVNSMGVEWATIMRHVAPDQIGVYATSAMSQLDDNGFGGLLKARLKGERVTTKQLALGFNSMPADFINAYVVGSMGATGSMVGACASFLYNLRAGMEDIRSGRCRVVVVGSSEAPIVPEIIDGYATMGALATDAKLCRLDGVTRPDYRRASRPFADNCGFTIAESSQQVILMDDALALELGATVYGAVTDVFVNADGYKRSISAPGPGNYLTFTKAVAAAKNLLGEEAVRYRSFVQAHGSSTPQNRVTESAIFDRTAQVFGISNWPITAVKAYIGHSLAPASGDQLVNALGVFDQGILPGIKTIDKVADDVLQSRCHLSLVDVHFDQAPDIAFLNSKGFGGNNATACILSPQRVRAMLAKRYGKQAIAAYNRRNAMVVEQADNYHQAALQGDFRVHYHFGQNMVDDKEITLSDIALDVPGFADAVDLTAESIYKDMC